MDGLRELPDNSVHCVVTSPPYWALRDYGVDGQLGLEPTLAEYLDNQVAVFAEVRRVLRPDGVCWVNMGDSYCSSGGAQQGKTGQRANRRFTAKKIVRKNPPKIKIKDMIGQPWALAFALRDSGWWLRRDIIWEKPNCQPSSAIDRPTVSHEYIFLLTKKSRYFYDREAVKEKTTGNAHQRGTKLDTPRERSVVGHKGFQKSKNKIVLMRNARTVWKIPNQALKNYPHYAAFPEAIPARCIKAGSSEKGCCSECGTPLKRVIAEEVAGSIKASDGWDSKPGAHGTIHREGREAGKMRDLFITKTTGWKPGCDCGAGVIPCTVLDPYSGTARTGQAALKLGRNYIGIELHPKHAAYSREVLKALSPKTEDRLPEDRI